MERLTLSQIFAKKLREAMDRNPNADTGQKVQERSGISQQHVSKLLRGIATPTLETVEVLAKAVGVQPWELLVDNEQVRRQIYEVAISQPVSQSEQKVVNFRRKRK